MSIPIAKPLRPRWERRAAHGTDSQRRPPCAEPARRPVAFEPDQEIFRTLAGIGSMDEFKGMSPSYSERRICTDMLAAQTERPHTRIGGIPRFT
jgi:hypothetical protein